MDGRCEHMSVLLFLRQCEIMSEKDTFPKNEFPAGELCPPTLILQICHIHQREPAPRTPQGPARGVSAIPSVTTLATLYSLFLVLN